MATQADAEPEAGVEFVHEADGSITARDIETDIASFGDTKAEALAMLADALELHETGGEPIEDEDAFLHDIGLDPDDIEPDSKELPEFMR